MKSLLTFLIIVNLSFNCYANEAVSLKKGDAAPYNGVLLDDEKANLLKNELLELDSLKKRIDIYKQLDDINKNQLDKVLESNRKLSDELIKQKNPYEPLIWFGLGVLATSMSAYAFKKITSN